MEDVVRRDVVRKETTRVLVSSTTVVGRRWEGDECRKKRSNIKVKSVVYVFSDPKGAQQLPHRLG
jgi:hypothetical protein